MSDDDHGCIRAALDQYYHHLSDAYGEDVTPPWDEEADDSDADPCPDCNGTGEIDLSVGPSRVVECEACEGSGEVKG